MSYELLKSIHSSIALIWVATLIYLPISLGLKAQAVAAGRDVTKVSARQRLVFRALSTPAMIIVWILGLILASEIGAWGQGWFTAKIVLVLLLSAFHGLCARLIRAGSGKGALSFALAALAPVLAGIIIFLVVAKPF